MKKAVQLSVERELQRYSVPAFTPFTTTIKLLLKEVELESIPERSLLEELEKRISLFFPTIDKTLRQALSEKNNKQLVDLYSLLIKKIKEFRQILISRVLDQPISNVAFSQNIKKAAILDINRYNRAISALRELLPVASEIDSTIRDLSIQLRTMEQAENMGLPEEMKHEMFPSLETEEEEEKQHETLDFPEEFKTFFNNIGSWNSAHFSKYIEELTQRVVPEERKTFEHNLNALRSLATTGSIKPKAMFRGGKEKKFLTNRYNALAETLNEYKDIISGSSFEDTIVAYPELLKKIVSRQIKIEQYGIGTEKIKGAPVIETSRLTNDEGQIHPEAGGVFNQFFVPPELKTLFKKFNINDEFEVLETAQETNDKFFKPIVLPELIENPEIYVEPNDLRLKSGLNISVLSESEKRAYLMNRAAISYSLYQFHQTHALIAAILKRLVPYIRKNPNDTDSIFVKEQMNNLKQILKIAFPYELVTSARENIMDDDKALLTKQLIGKQVPGLRTKELFGNIDTGDDWYDKMIETMMPQFFKKALKDAPETEAANLKSRRQNQQKEENLLDIPGKKEKATKQNLYFIFSAVDRGGPVTRMLSYAYGGIYWIRIKDSTKPQEYKGYEQVKLLNPTYFSKKVILKSLLDYEQETLSQNAPEKVADMATHVESVIETKPVDDKTAFYLAYGRSSLDNTIDTKIGWSQDLMSVLNEWVKNYNLKTQNKPEPIPQVTMASSEYTYLYPINWLFK
jgi:hypothetical protein